MPAAPVEIAKAEPVSHPRATPPRARGDVVLATKPGRTGSVIGGLRQAGSLKVLFPRNTGPDLQAVLVNTAGGITGGDAFSLMADVAPGTALTVSTQAAERAYRAQPEETGLIRNQMRVGDQGQLTWVPQETILFQGSALRRHLTVDLHAHARLLLCEPLVFGRTAMGEVLTDMRFEDRIEIRRSGRPLFLDAMRLDGDVAAHLARAPIAAKAGALATLVYVAPNAEAHLAPIRERLGPKAGASLVQSDVLVLRALADDSFALRQTLMPILSRLSGAPLPRPWML